jgi:hypothetical protein
MVGPGDGLIECFFGRGKVGIRVKSGHSAFWGSNPKPRN